ncbi:MAG: C1 family peptidase [Clostridia bacterium]|nr:C1 family peptidase [Clostridia bacterium]
MSDAAVRPDAGGAIAPSAAAADGAVAPELVARFSAEAKADPLVRATANAIRKNGVQAVALNQDIITARPYTFSHEIETGPITHQKKSGRCWMFAGLNTLRVAVMRRCKLKEFELSQAYQMFWDKFERSNYFLEAIIETRDEDLHGRLVAWLLDAPLNDGGQWDMFVNLVEKYGVVPKYAMPESFHSSDSAGMNRILTLKLREYARRLREMYHQGNASLAELRAEKERMLGEVYRLLVRFLGEPPSRFDFEYRDKDGDFHRDPGLTPQEFLQAYVGLDLSEYVSLIHAPTADKPFGRTYTVQYLGYVKGGRDVLYLNVEIETLKEMALRQLLDGEPVWFGCDVGKMSDRASGVLDARLYDYEGVLGVRFDLDKAGRLDYGESRMTHAMVFTGVNLVNGRPNRWKVENSWGTEPGHQGFFVMSDDWFDEFMYQVVVKKSYLPPELQEALKQPPIVLPPWDPMGSLAR